MTIKQWKQGAEYDKLSDTYWRPDLIGLHDAENSNNYYTGYFSLQGDRVYFEVEYSFGQFQDTETPPHLKGEQ